MGKNQWLLQILSNLYKILWKEISKWLECAATSHNEEFLKQWEIQRKWAIDMAGCTWESSEHWKEDGWA